MKPARGRRAKAEPETAASLVDAVLARLGGQGRALEQRVFASYEEAVGPGLRPRTEPESVRGNTLFVRVASSALAHQLILLKREILDRMALDLGPNVIQDLRTRVGPLRGATDR